MAPPAAETPATSDLVSEARGGDPGAWGLLYDRLAPDVQRFLLGLGLLMRSEVEDAVQETFLRLVKSLARFEDGRPLRPFVLGIARHVALDLLRRRRVPTAALEGLAAEDSVAAEVERRERRDGVAQALAALEPEERVALSLRHTARLTLPRLAESLGCSVPTARKRLRRAARRFAVELKTRGIAAGSPAGEVRP